jgi:aminodeoxyfutalosine synthase
VNNLYNQGLLELGIKANKIRRARHSNTVYYNINKHINPTNICKDVCKFCAFSASRKNPNPYSLGIDEIIASLIDSSAQKITEVHIVGAHNPEMGLAYYTELFRQIHSNFPTLHIKALTAAEVNFLSEIENMSYEAVLEAMAESGVKSMPGGGAEIFDEGVRAKIAKGKVSSKNWLKIHELWHKMGKKSNATMLFGHIENEKHRIDHLERLKKLQDKTGGFNAFIPLVYNIENNFLNVKKQVAGVEILKTVAISRIVLDNIPNIKAYWVAMGFNLALVAQEFGANDIDGTIQRENIISKAGAKSGGGLDLVELKHQITDAGFEPVERDSLYNEL